MNYDDPVYVVLGDEKNPVPYRHKGLTKLEYFTAAALTGLLANPNIVNTLNGSVRSKDIETASLFIAKKVIASINNNDK